MVGPADATEPRLAPLPHAFHAEVREKLRARADAAALDGLLLLDPANVTYATGWHAPRNERPVGAWIPTDGDARLLVPVLEREVAMGVRGFEVATYDEYPGDVPPVLWMIGETGSKRLAIDKLDAALLDRARARLDRLDLTNHVLPLRAVKCDAEVALIREAARFADRVLDVLLAEGGTIVRSGGTEADLLAACTGPIRSLLDDTHGPAFRGTKLALTASLHSGPRAALPHGSVTERRPEPGDPVIAGIGCSVGGYHAESGVTLVVGQPGADQLRIMDAMSASGAATIDALEAGLSCAEVNEAAMEPIRAAGLSDTIRHRIGHGMGVDGHEAPWLAPGDETTTAPGMVFSCEPGVYRPGLDGWRTIDTLIVGRNGVEVASRFLDRHPADSRVLPL